MCDAAAQNDSPFPVGVTTTVTLVSFKLAAAKEVYTRTDSLAGGPGAISWFSLPLLQQVDPTDTVIIIECHDQAGAGRPFWPFGRS